METKRAPLSLVVILAAVVSVIVYLVLAAPYGYFRDELYYLAAARHLDFGYVDFPPFIAAAAALTGAVLGESLTALHVFPALAGAALIVLVGLMARELGGGRFAQGLAALAALTAPVYLSTHSVLTMDAFDELWWALAAYLLIVMLARGPSRGRWLAFGVVVGLGMMTKVTVAYLVVALGIGLLATSHRRLLLNRWPWIAGLVALVLFLPYVLWQVHTGWPTLDFWRYYATGKTYPVTPLDFLVQQITVMNLLTLPLWLAGLYFFLFSSHGRRWRPLGIAYVVLYVVLTLQQAKFYFLSPTYTWLFAGGGVLFETWLRHRMTWLRVAYPALLAGAGLLMAPSAMPLLPVETFIRYVGALGFQEVRQERLQTAELPQFFADHFGWPEMVQAVAGVYNSLPSEERARACIYTWNYGEASAVDFFGPALGLPNAISGHNSYAIWGYGDCTGDPLITVGVPRSDLEDVWASIEQAATVECGYCMPYENHTPIFIARDMRTPLTPELWLEARHFD